MGQIKKNILGKGKFKRKSCTATNRKKILHWKKVLGEDFDFDLNFIISRSVSR